MAGSGKVNRSRKAARLVDASRNQANDGSEKIWEQSQRKQLEWKQSDGATERGLIGRICSEVRSGTNSKNSAIRKIGFTFPRDC